MKCDRFIVNYQIPNLSKRCYDADLFGVNDQLGLTNCLISQEGYNMGLLSPFIYD